MNKAAFLSLIRQSAPVTDQDVNDLEKLVVNFPYCQSAHLLIAKAAYDKGSMLSNQKLRKAAVYATNRKLFKKLIQTTAHEVQLQPVVETILTSVLPLTEIPAINVQTELSAIPDYQENITEPFLDQETNFEALTELTSENVSQEKEPEIAEITTPESSQEAAPALVETLKEDIEIREVELDAELPLVEKVAETGENEPEEAVIAIEEANPEEQVSINQPEEKEIAVAFNLKGNTEEALLRETLASFDHYLFQPEKEEPEEILPLPEPTANEVIRRIFEKDTIGYWMASSRMGECLQLKDEFTRNTPYCFRPELILEYTKNHELKEAPKPVEGPLTEQLNIIDQFLKLTPKMKNINARIRTEAQEDLSIKSSKISKNLASENFANILVQQGKIKKAIKIYEHLILKIPEKKAYFVAQIEKLQNQA